MKYVFTSISNTTVLEGAYGREYLVSIWDWPRIEGIVYGEEASPKDILAPRLTPDGVLIQGYFSGSPGSSGSCRKKKIPPWNWKMRQAIRST